MKPACFTPDIFAILQFCRLANITGVVAPPRKLFPNWTKVSLRTTHDWRIKFKRANEKHSSEQVLPFPILRHV